MLDSADALDLHMTRGKHMTWACLRVVRRWARSIRAPSDLRYLDNIV